MHSVTYSPALALPPEITAEIFSHYVHKPHDIANNIDGPLVLTRVCRRWREICQSTCSLWASVFLHGEDMDWDDEKYFPFLERWLSRAGSHPLDLIIFKTWPKEIHRPFALLLQHSSQWRSLTLWLDPSNPFQNDMIHGRVSSLVKLSIDMLDSDGHAAVTAFSEAPSLREVRLANLGPLQWIALPYPQLTHLDISGIRLQKCVEILKATTNLEVLDVCRLQVPQVSGPSPPLPLTLGHIHTLSLRTIAQGALFDHLTLPGLRTLSLNELGNQCISQFLNLIIRSSPSLKSLRLKSMQYAASTRCLRGIPLFLPKPGNPALLVELLTTDDQFLPALCEITITSCPREISSSALVEMLASRAHGTREGVARLKLFHLSFSRTRHSGIAPSTVDEINNRVRAFVEEGLDVKVTLMNNCRIS
ncbi:hypothetical protein B0H14DRAFT_2787167, partial [Mycena olivaceomarginata]